MNFLDSEDQIIACSTSNSSNAAISIIRLSGFKDLSFLDDCFTTKVTKPRYSYYGSLYDSKVKMDDIVLTFFKGPNSYNGENILELGVHGNILNVKKIIHFFIDKKSFRYAYPGEFSYRALRNNKLSLSQVEGLDLLLNANSDYALSQGNSLMSGELKDAYTELYKSFLNHKSSVELSIDFYEDLGEEQSQKQLMDSFESFHKKFNSLHSRCLSNSHNLLKPDLCLVGKPNSGKSSLFNALLNSDRAIVSSTKGTTRDFIKENILINDVLYSLIDTAGIRQTDDEIEEIGINKALNLFNNAFYKILLIDPTDFDTASFNINFSDIDIFIFTHVDLLESDDSVESIIEAIKNRCAPIEPLFDSTNGSIEPKDIAGSMGADKQTGSMGPIKNSGSMGAKINNGPIGPDLESGYVEPIFLRMNTKDPLVGDLDILFKSISLKYVDISSSNPIVIDRHIDVIKKLNESISTYKQLLFSEDDISIISSELNIIGHCISELIGIIRPEEVLNNIFDNFCIGK